MSCFPALGGSGQSLPTPEHTQEGSSMDQLALWRFLTALGGRKGIPEATIEAALL